MIAPRSLVVCADDFGIGPATSQGILDLAVARRVTCTVLLVTSPYAEAAVRAWRWAGRPVDLGWHPCLTLDRPVLSPARVPSLVGPDGRFRPLRRFLPRLLLGHVRPAEIKAELRAQYHRFLTLVGEPPVLVNAHHHLHILGTVGDLLRAILRQQQPLPYLRRVREPWPLLRRIPEGGRKRALLNLLGSHAARLEESRTFPGNDWLAGVADPAAARDADLPRRWLTGLRGRVVEWMCHPGHLDLTLAGRDGSLRDGRLLARVHEYGLLRGTAFPEACRAAGFALVSPSQLAGIRPSGRRHAA